MAQRNRSTPLSSLRATRVLPHYVPTLAFAAGLCGLLAYLTGFAFTAPDASGLCEDDGVYLVTAQALAEGRGYRRLDLPGEPCQTKYPVLYPLLLSWLWRLAGAYPANLGWLRLLNVAAAGLAVGLGVVYVARYLIPGRAGQAVVAVLCLALPELRFYTYFTMSELTFAVWLLVALWAAERAAAAAGRRAVAYAISAALAAGLAFLTRTIGVTLILALIAWLGYRRRFGLAAITGVIAGLSVAAHGLWCHAAAAADAPLRHAALLQYELDYGAWLPHRLPEVGQVLIQNFFKLAFAHCFFLVRVPLAWLDSMFSGGATLVLAHLAVWVTLLASLAGFVTSARRRLSAAHVLMPLYFGAVLVWPFEPLRFLVPLFIFVIAFAVLGWTSVAQELGRWPVVRHVRMPMAKPLALSLALGLAALYVAHHPILLGLTDSNARILFSRYELAEARDMAEQIRRYAPADAVIASYHAPATYLTTGRKAVALLPVTKPVAYFYSPARRWQTFCLRSAPQEAEVLTADALRGLADAYTEIGVRYQFVSTEATPAENQALAAHLQAFPERYRLVYLSPGRTVVGREWLAP